MQAFQVLGITEQSLYPEASTLRRCAASSPRHRGALLDLALRRLRGMLSVGVYEKVDETRSALAAAIGADLTQPGWMVRAAHSKQC